VPKTFGHICRQLLNMGVVPVSSMVPGVGFGIDAGGLILW
jgi:hypothetical protein